MNGSFWTSAAGCGRCGLNRRSFLQGCAACAVGSAGLLASQARPVAAAEPIQRPQSIEFLQVIPVGRAPSPAPDPLVRQIPRLGSSSDQ